MSSKFEPKFPQVIYVDEAILVINKPEGLLSVADGYNSDLPHVKPILEEHYGQLWMVHRLDKETSGVMVLARNAQTHKALNQAFIDRQVSKKYLCLVNPVPDWKTQEINLPLSVNTGRRHLTRVDEQNGKPAQSFFQLIKHNSATGLLSCEIKTGYRHQIRAHLYHLGLGILGDPLYQPPRPSKPGKVFPRMMLHAWQLSFIHPGNLELVFFEAEPPVIFDEILGEIIPTN